MAETAAAPPSTDGRSERQRQVDALAALVDVQARAATATDADALRYLIVNDIAQVVAADIVFLWDRGRGRLTAVSGAAQPDWGGPLCRYVTRLCRELARAAQPEPRAVSAVDAPERLKPDWSTHLPAHALWLPLPDGGTRNRLFLLMCRARPYVEAEARLAARIAPVFGVTMARLEGRGLKRGLARRRGLLSLLAVAALVGCMFIPVTQSVLAPALVAPIDPLVLRAPLKAVIKEVLVEPYAEVRPGTVLLRLDDTDLKARHEQAVEALRLAALEFRQTTQAALDEGKARALREVLEGRMRLRALEARHLEELLQRTQVVAPTAGVVIHDGRDDLEGRPVELGETVMRLADPSRTELTIWLAATDDIALPERATVAFFANASPEDPVPATLSERALLLSASPDGILARELIATFDGRDVAPPRVGSSGTARIEAGEVPLYRFLFRRPLSTVRQWLGV